MPTPLHGIVVPTVTPMDASGEHVHPEAAALLTDFLITHGMQGLFVNGTTGEGPLLHPEERRRHLEAVVEAAAHRVPVAAQIGAATTRQSIALAEHAARLGVEVIVCMTPFFLAYTDDELAEYFLSVARAVPDTPVYLYTIPARAGNAISAALAERLAREPNIVGLKDSTGSIEQLRRYLALPGLEVLCGADAMALEALEAGAAGLVSGPANLLPELYGALWQAWSAGEREAAQELHGLVRSCLDVLNNGRSLGIFKALAAARVPGLGRVRPPQAHPGPEETRLLRERLYHLLQPSTLPEAAYGWLA